MNYDFDNWRANMVLEALHSLNERWQITIDNTDDIDVKADYANEVVRLHILLEGFERKAVEEFGPGITKSFLESMDPTALPTSGLHQSTNTGVEADLSFQSQLKNA